jgi:hypothetical protein
MMSVTLATPALEALVRTYFHQDYDLIGTVDDNIDQYLADFADLAPSLPLEVDQVSATLTEPEIEALMSRFGCELLPPDELSYREWLTQIADRVRAAT